MNRLATIGDVQQRIEAITTFELPSNLITEEELEARIAQIPTHTGPTQQDFTALTQTLTAALNQVAANVESKATQQDVSLAALQLTLSSTCSALLSVRLLTMTRLRRVSLLFLNDLLCLTLELLSKLRF